MASSMVALSVKAVVLRGGAVLLGENDRDEWELVGGRPDPGEDLHAALVREVQEESGLTVAVGPEVLDGPFEVVPQRFVRIRAFRCEAPTGATVRPSAEHRAVRFVPPGELAVIRLPTVYRRAIDAARGLPS